MSNEELFEKLSKAVLVGDIDRTRQLSEEATKAELDPLVIINEGMAPGAREAGVKFSKGEYFLPQLVMAGEAMKGGLEVLLPLITAEAQEKAKGVVVIGSVEGDVHDIGKNIVGALLVANGFRVIDLGVDVAADDFVDKVRAENAHILAMGSYMSTTLSQMSAVMDALQGAGLRNDVRVMVGGAAVTQAFADKIGADAYGDDAAEAVERAIDMMEVLHVQ